MPEMLAETDKVYSYELSLSTLNSSQAQINSYKTLDYLLQPTLLRFSEVMLGQISQQLRHALRQEEMAFKNRYLFILFEKELGCDPKTDHLVQKNVFPLYKYQFEQIFKTLQDKLYISLYSESSYLSERIRTKMQEQMGDIIEMADSFSLAFALSCKETVDMVKLLEHVYQLSIEEKIRLRREIQYLKEYLVTKHRIETLYTTDGESSDILRRRLKNVAYVTTNQLMDELVSLAQEKRSVESDLCKAIIAGEKNAFQAQKLKRLVDDQEKYLSAYKEQIDSLIAQLAELEFQRQYALRNSAASNDVEDSTDSSRKDTSEVKLVNLNPTGAAINLERHDSLQDDILRYLTGEPASKEDYTDFETYRDYTLKLKGIIMGLADKIQDFNIREKVLASKNDYDAAVFLIDCVNYYNQLVQYQQYVGVAPNISAHNSAYTGTSGEPSRPIKLVSSQYYQGNAPGQMQHIPQYIAVKTGGKEGYTSGVSLSGHDNQPWDVQQSFQYRDAMVRYKNAKSTHNAENPGDTYNYALLQTRGVAVQVTNGLDCGFEISPGRALFEDGIYVASGGKLRAEKGRVFVSGKPMDLRHVSNVTYADKNENKIDITDWYVNYRDYLADCCGCHITEGALIKNQWGEEIRDYAGFLGKKASAAADAEQRITKMLEKLKIGILPGDPQLKGIFAHIRATLERRRLASEKWREYERYTTRQSIGGSGRFAESRSARSSIVCSGEGSNRPHSSARVLSAQTLRVSKLISSEAESGCTELLTVKCDAYTASFRRRQLDFTLESGSSGNRGPDVFPLRQLFQSQVK